MLQNKLFAAIFGLLIIVSSSCKKEEPVKSDEKEIISFVIEGQTGNSVINSEAAAIAIAMPDSVALDSLAPTITISEKSIIVPASGEFVDFSQGSVNYKVTAEDNSTKEWVVTVANTLSSEADIISFTVNPPSFQRGETVYGNQDISFQVFYGASLNALRATIQVSENAAISPESDAAVDFSSGSAIYTVTAQDGTQKIWNTHVSYAQNTANEITSFTVPGQIGTSSISKPNLNFDVDYGTDLSAITPVIELSYGATVVPASGTPVDFSATGSVTYVVTSEDGQRIANWVVQAHFPLTPANDAKFQYVGRWNFSNPAQPRVWTPGAYVVAKFAGTKCQISLVDEYLYSSNYNYIVVILDGAEYLKYRTTGTANVIDISEHLTAGDHTITIYKVTETGMGYIDFKGLYLESADALLTPDPLPIRKIEFIGNSIVVGSNLDISEAPCSDNPNPWFINHNAYFSYGALTARNLDAQFHITGVSGIGLIQSCCNMGFTMPQVFTKTNLRKEGSDWDFTQYIPDVVTISLGQNDGIQDSTTFCTAYINFISQIRTHYPGATLILLNSPMADNSLNAVLVEYTNAIADYLVDQGDANIITFELTHNLNSGCGYHPDLTQHETIANELTGFIQATMGW
jgi:hypothetical protein